MVYSSNLLKNQITLVCFVMLQLNKYLRKPCQNILVFFKCLVPNTNCYSSEHSDQIGEHDCLLGCTKSNVSKVLMNQEKGCQGKGR